MKNKIEAIRKSAVNQVLSLAMRGQITGTESAARQNVINRAFEMQAFPWMTTMCFGTPPKPGMISSQVRPSACWKAAPPWSATTTKPPCNCSGILPAMG